MGKDDPGARSDDLSEVVVPVVAMVLLLGGFATLMFTIFG